MTHIGYQASQEQFSPSELLGFVKLAQNAGFDAVLSSDHIEPWSKEQGFSGFSWSWLGSALEATSLLCGVVTVPGYRYHPVILAQAVATLEEMYPNRFFLTMGSGEALNEHVVGGKWPVKQIRNEILKESAEIMRKLWRGEEVTSYGHIIVEEAQLYVKLKKMPHIYGAALTESTAAWLGSWADGMITTSRPISELKKMLDAFYKGGGKGKPVILKAQL
jgi:coenzyme F420-dependent glucose-6-phosphate dehydrogenase